jgi:cytochrome c-type biogenesis protein CcmH
MEMIRGMVSGLSERLATEGGPPSDWARLISALGVLGQTDEARAILEEARAQFSEDATALDMFTRAAERAGIGE